MGPRRLLLIGSVFLVLTALVYVANSFEPLALESPHGEVRLPVETIHPLDVHVVTAPGQQCPQTAVAIPRLLSREGDEFFPQLGVAVGTSFVAIATAIDVEELASLALGVAKLRHQERHVPSHAHKLQP
jgi:hypothetical protein